MKRRQAGTPTKKEEEVPMEEKEEKEEEERRRIPQEVAGQEWMVWASKKTFYNYSNIVLHALYFAFLRGNLLRTYLLPAVRSNCSYAPK